ncbi:MAG: hypothetical protein DHS20C19_04970 [Acidimicrobiales bacterium]|nr:MAG: hypothetical protein DHS20C19_04970 [Acidimicrobiales bacterium]
MADLEATRREERDFLLASLDDLEAEYAAGDLDEADYAALKSDYTTRAARAIRSVDRAEPPTRPERRDWRRIALWTALVVIVASLAGMWIAEFSGTRGVGESTTGDIRRSVRERLFQAQQALGTDPDEAIEIYDSILEEQPANAEALAYRGWLTRLGGDPEAGQSCVERAVLADPTYPDALVFASSIALELDDPATAAARLAQLDSIEAPAYIAQLVQGQGLRIAVAEALLATGEPDSFAASGMTVAQVNHAAESVLTSDPDRGIALYDLVLAQRPDDAELLTFAGFYQALVALEVGSDALPIMERGYHDLSLAVELDPEDPRALVYRAFVGFYVDELEQSRADLAAYDALDAGREDLEAFLFQFGLREALA